MSEYQKGLVSICIPVFNHEKTLRETLLSALHQSYDNIEIILVDDCSTDNSLKIAHSFQDPRLQIYENEHNLGMVGNWNRVLSLAKGEYALVLHGDDRLYITSIEKKVALMERKKNVMLAMSASLVINGNNEILKERHPFNKACILDGRKLALFSYRTKNIYGEPGNILFRTEVARQSGGFAENTIYATDWDLWLRISCLGTVAYSNEVLMDYRITKSNVTSKTNTKEMLADDKIMTANIEKYGLLKIHTIDRMLHTLSITSRTLARNLYLALRV